jgi:adenylate kinase family enzyme
LSNGLKKLLFVKNNIPNLVYSKESITFETSNNKNPAATEINGSIKMATAKQIFNEIDGLNPQKSTISSLGDYVSQSSQMVSDSIYKEVLSFLPKDSLAYKILTSSERYTDKQLWVISYELEKNTEFNKLITERISIRNARSNAKLEASKSKLQANKAGSQDVLDFVKNNGKRLADYYEFIKKNKKYAREFYSKKFTMESANEFLSK